MSTKKIILGATALLAIGIGGYLACDTEEQDGIVERGSEIEVTIKPHLVELPLRDNPSMQPTQIIAAISGISAHHVEEGWVQDVWRTTTIDLLDPEFTMNQILGASSMPDGMYDQIRFDIVHVAARVDRKWYDVEVPSDVLKIHTNFCLIEGETSSLEVQWNVAEALHYDERRGFWMSPCLKIFGAPTCVDDLEAPRS